MVAGVIIVREGGEFIDFYSAFDITFCVRLRTIIHVYYQVERCVILITAPITIRRASTSLET